MGYIENMYGHRDVEFIEGFLAAMNTYAIWMDGNRYIGSPEKELKAAMKQAVTELYPYPEYFDKDIARY